MLLGWSLCEPGALFFGTWEVFRFGCFGRWWARPLRAMSRLQGKELWRVAGDGCHGKIGKIQWSWKRQKRPLTSDVFKYPDCQSNPSFIFPSFLMSNSFQQIYIIIQSQTCVCNVQVIILSHPLGSGRNGKRQLGASVPLEPFAIPFVAALPGDTIGRHRGPGGAARSKEPAFPAFSKIQKKKSTLSLVFPNWYTSRVPKMLGWSWCIRWLKHSLSTSSSCNKTCFCH